LRARLIVALVVLTACVAQTAAGAAGLASGRLTGKTQITYGCPGPVRVGAPACDHWITFPRARFTVTRLGATGAPIAGTKQLVVSDASGRFTLVLTAGRYRLALLPQQHTRGGSPISVTVNADRVTWALVRFQGFPQMV
jgi:hypothetical protein